MKTPATIEIIGTNGDLVTVSGPGQGDEGIELLTDPAGLLDEAPIKTIWQQSVFQEGATYVDTAIEPKDFVLNFALFDETGEDWEGVDQRFYGLFEVGKPATLVYRTDNSERTMQVVKHEATKTVTKHDPRFSQCSKMTVTLRAPRPFWVENTLVEELAFSGSGTKNITVDNETDRPMFPQWAFTAPGRWTIPDVDENDPHKVSRRIVTPQLRKGQNLTVDTYPLRETYVSEDRTNIAGLFAGVDFLGFIPPHTTGVVLPVKFEGETGGCQIRLVEEFQRPFGGRW